VKAIIGDRSYSEKMVWLK